MLQRSLSTTFSAFSCDLGHIPLSSHENSSSRSGGGRVATGSNNDGSSSNQPLGNNPLRFGLSLSTDNQWINSMTTVNLNSRGFYAMSSIQEIPTAIPEPTTIIASLLVGAGLLPLKGRRQKN